MIVSTTFLGLGLNGNPDYKAITSSPSGKYIALSAADGTLSIYAPSIVNPDGRCPPTAILKDHEGAVWDVAFAPIEFGPLCASVGADRRLVIHKEVYPQQWTPIFSEVISQAVLLSVQFAASPAGPPNTFQATALSPSSPVGLHLVVSAADGLITILSLNADHTWSRKTFLAHVGGCNVARWSTLEHGEVGADRSNPGRKIASAGVDGQLVIWTCSNEAGENSGPAWTAEQRLIGHYRNVIDICWMPANDSKDEKIASLGDDGTIIMWSKPLGHRQWVKGQVLPRACPSACRIGWSLDGSVIGVTVNDKNQRLRMFNVVQDTLTEAIVASPTGTASSNMLGVNSGDLVRSY